MYSTPSASICRRTSLIAASRPDAPMNSSMSVANAPLPSNAPVRGRQAESYADAAHTCHAAAPDANRFDRNEESAYRPARRGERWELLRLDRRGKEGAVAEGPKSGEDVRRRVDEGDFEFLFAEFVRMHGDTN